MREDVSSNLVHMTVRPVSRDTVLEAVRQACSGDTRPTMDELAAEAGVSRAAFYRLVGNRQALFEAVGIEVPPTPRDRILASAAQLLAEHGLGQLSMDELAARADVSRATLYRLFPGKPVLLRELVRTYSPMEVIAETLEAMGDSPPSEVMPVLARNIAEAGSGRVGLLRSLLFEVTGGTEDVDEAVSYALDRGIGALAGYLDGQMAAGRLRRTHPLLAVQAFTGPIILHLLTRSLAEDRLGFDVPVDEAADELARLWLLAMTPGSQPHP
jgi:AcrR family transcriptional regulator